MELSTWVPSSAFILPMPWIYAWYNIWLPWTYMGTGVGWSILLKRTCLPLSTRGGTWTRTVQPPMNFKFTLSSLPTHEHFLFSFCNYYTTVSTKCQFEWGRRDLNPAISTVRAWCVNQFHYVPINAVWFLLSLSPSLCEPTCLANSLARLGYFYNALPASLNYLVITATHSMGDRGVGHSPRH